MAWFFTASWLVISGGTVSSAASAMISVIVFLDTDVLVY
jgi:hypothetical protein